MISITLNIQSQNPSVYYENQIQNTGIREEPGDFTSFYCCWYFVFE